MGLRHQRRRQPPHVPRAETDLWDWSITPDVYVRDIDRDTVRLVSVSTSGGRGDGASIEPTISADGRYVLFSSEATNLVPDDTNEVFDVFRRDLRTGRTTLVSAPAPPTPGCPG